MTRRPTGDVAPPALQRSVLLFAEQSGTRPQQMLVADPAQQADPVEEFQDLDRPLAPQPRRITKLRRAHDAVALSDLARGCRQFLDGASMHVQILHHLEYRSERRLRAHALPNKASECLKV